MSADERAVGWHVALVRCVGAAGILLALTLFLALPAAGVSCHRNSPFKVCYPGLGLISGSPSVRVPDNIVPGKPRETAKLREYIASTAPLPNGTRVLAVAATVVLIAGLLSVAARRPAVRAIVVAGTALTGAVLLMATEITAIGQLTEDVRGKTRLFPSYYGEVPDVHDIVETGLGFWLSLAALAAAAAFGAGTLLHAWFASRNAEPETWDDEQATGTG